MCRGEDDIVRGTAASGVVGWDDDDEICCASHRLGAAQFVIGVSD